MSDERRRPALAHALAGWSAHAATQVTLGPPRGGGWLTLAELAAAPGGLVDQIADHHGTRRVVGGTFLVARVARAVAEPVLHAHVVAGETPDLGPALVSVLPTAEGRFSAVGYHAARCGRATAEAMADELLATFAPLIEAVHREVAIGRRGLLGLVADAIAASAATLVSADVYAAAAAILDRLPAGGAPRPALAAGGDAWWARRSSCCLAFHIEGHGYCVTCPLARSGRARAAGRPPPVPPPRVRR